MVLIGYSGHAFVVHGILKDSGKKISGYCDVTEKEYNPFGLHYFGTEHSETGLDAIKTNGYFIAVGDNQLRKKIYHLLKENGAMTTNAIHPSAVIDSSVKIAEQAVMIAANATVNPLASIGTGAVCNTGCIIEHECMVGDFVHVGPGAVLCGNVRIGEGSFVGANAVIRQGITVGKNAMIGAGAVVVKDVPDNANVMGVPAR